MTVRQFEISSRTAERPNSRTFFAPAVFFGDSITQGYGVRPEDSFPSLVAKELGISSVNAGVPGDTMASGLARIEHDVLARRPRLTLVEFGGNDFLREADRRRGVAVRQSLDFPLPASQAGAKLRLT